jgi:lipoprotein signal peptidase
VAVAGTCAVDQITKLISARAGGGLGGVNSPMRNTEFSLGLATAPWPAQVALMAVGVVVGAALLTLGVRRSVVPGWAAGLVIGGALSNLVDRTLLRSVRDFLAIGPVVLNVADLAVVLGLAAALVAARPVRATTVGRR